MAELKDFPRMTTASSDTAELSIILMNCRPASGTSESSGKILWRKILDIYTAGIDCDSVPGPR